MAAGALIVWVIQEDTFASAASSQDAQNVVEFTIGSGEGIRVGDADTLPTAGTFENSPFITSNRGFEMIVRRSDMRIVYSAPQGNDRPIDGQDFLNEVLAVELE